MTSDLRRTISCVLALKSPRAGEIARMLEEQRLAILPEFWSGTRKYWSRVMPGITDACMGCAVAGHTELLLLTRLQVVSAHQDTPDVLRDFVERILLRDEADTQFAIEALFAQAGTGAEERAAELHLEGMRALGLPLLGRAVEAKGSGSRSRNRPVSEQHAV